MVAYNFQAQFVADVESGKKTQTIREHGKKQPPKVGDELQLYTGMRTKNCRLLRRAKCTSLEVIEIRSHFRHVLIGTPSGDTYQFNRLTDGVIEKFAKADGFESVDAFFKYFESGGIGNYFSGFLIRWAD
jgi:hypothetical protein